MIVNVYIANLFHWNNVYNREIAEHSKGSILKRDDYVVSL